MKEIRIACYDVYTYILACSSERERDVRRINEKSIRSHSWVIYAVFAIIGGPESFSIYISEVGVVVKLVLQRTLHCEIARDFGCFAGKIFIFDLEIFFIAL